jgi:hypothetical protein
MSEPEGFQAQLESAVEAKRRFLDENTLPRLKESFRTFQSLFENLYNILMRKSLVQEDPYKYEQKISEIEVPAKGEILDLEKGEKLSQRLSSLHAQLEFLNTYYQLSVDFLDLQRLRRIIGLVRYINWSHVSETSPDATTAVLAETLGKIRPGSDNVSTSIISTSLTQLQVLSSGILGLLKEIFGFQRQSYKLMLRKQLVSPMRQTLEKLYALGPDKAYKKIKGVFASTMKGKPFYRDLVEELLQEEFSEDAPQLRQKSLSVLKITEEKHTEIRKKPDHRVILLEAVRLILPAGGHLRDTLRKVILNQETLAKSRQGFGGKLRSWWQKRFHSRGPNTVVEIRYFDARSSATRTETIDFHNFVEGVRRRSSLLDALAQPDSASYARLSDASEQQIDTFLKKNIGELQLLYRRLEGLNEHFRREAPEERKEQLKGIKIELSGLKNCIARANRRHYEYVALQEEEIRLRQMGVPEQPKPS